MPAGKTVKTGDKSAAGRPEGAAGAVQCPRNLRHSFEDRERPWRRGSLLSVGEAVRAEMR